MICLRVSILKYVSDDPQPGLVACQFVDANGRHWCIIEKTAIVFGGPEMLGYESTFPLPGSIAVTVQGKTRNEAGDEIFEVSTAEPRGVESIEGESTFLVTKESLVEIA